MKPNPNANGSTFLPDDYEQPKSGGHYMKFQKGENRFRILSKPILGWIDWKDNKPLRFAMNDKPTAPVDPKKPIKHFWAMVVMNNANGNIEILEITQATIQSAIKTLSQDEEWGSPFDYDIKVTRTGEGMETEYTVTPSPKKPLAKEVMEQFVANPINLMALFVSGDPFERVADVKDSENLPF